MRLWWPYQKRILRTCEELSRIHHRGATYLDKFLTNLKCDIRVWCLHEFVSEDDFFFSFLQTAYGRLHKSLMSKTCVNCSPEIFFGSPVVIITKSPQPSVCMFVCQQFSIYLTAEKWSGDSNGSCRWVPVRPSVSPRIWNTVRSISSRLQETN